MEVVDQALGYLRDGFANVNSDPKGLLIALATAIFMQGWRQWIPFSVVAVVIHIAIETLAPVIGGSGGELALPPLVEGSFWIRAGVLLLGYLIIVAVFFFLKGLVFKPAAKAH
jgi:hypothetical protein